MSLIVGEGVGRSFDAGYVFRNARFRVGPGDRIGLVGPNGEGKTTLLRILAGLDEPTAGTVRRKADLRIGYLPQEPPAQDETTLWQSMLDVFAPLRAMEAELAESAAGLADDGDGSKLERYGRLQTRFEAAGGYDYETRIKAVLTGLGFEPPQHEMPLAHLSGGQRTRGLLGRLLLTEPDALLLDEPTNHLDLEAAEWLERYLQGFRRAIVVVSHDRYFLDKVTDRTWEVSFGRLESYRGAYTEYLKKRDDRFGERMKQWEAQQQYVATTEEFIRRNLAGQRTKEAQGRRTRLERFLATHAIEKPRQVRRLAARIAPRQRSGDLVLRAKELSVGYEAGRPVAAAGELEVRRGQRVALVGPNGSGKTTLLRSLLGHLTPLGGEVKLGANVSAGYLPQTHDNLRPDATVLQSLLDADAALLPDRARTLLGSFLFTGDEVFKRIDELSGGQRSRVIFAQLASLGPNVLMLDEPTNHLDLPSREVVQAMLANFAGTVIFVSHDRYLIQAVATHVWALADGRLHGVTGGWESYVRWRADHRAGTGQTSTPEKRDRHRRRQDNLEARRLAKRRRRIERRLETVGERIEQLEHRLAELLEQSGRAGEAGDMQRVEQIGAEYEQTDAELKRLWEEYTRLHDELEE